MNSVHPAAIATRTIEQWCCFIETLRRPECKSGQYGTVDVRIGIPHRALLRSCLRSTVLTFRGSRPPENLLPPGIVPGPNKLSTRGRPPGRPDRSRPPETTMQAFLVDSHPWDRHAFLKHRCPHL